MTTYYITEKRAGDWKHCPARAIEVENRKAAMREAECLCELSGLPVRISKSRDMSVHGIVIEKT